MSFAIEAFIDGYVEAALWADCMPAEPTDEELVQHALERGATREYVADADTDRLIADWRDSFMDSAETGGCESLDIRPGAREKMAKDCRDFVHYNADDLDAYVEACLSGERMSFDPSKGSPESYAGHDFWLTRNGHGAGFWDRGLGDLGERLTEAAKAYNTADDHTPVNCGDGTADIY